MKSTNDLTGGVTRRRYARGAANGNWNPGRILSTDGYVKVRVGFGHPLADSKGYAYEHLVVWAAAGRALPKPHQLLHHRNDDKTDNRLSNLRKIERSKHSVHHIHTRTRDALGRLLAEQRRASC